MTLHRFIRSIDRLSGAHPWAVIGIWSAIVLISLPLAAHQSKHLGSGGYTVAGSGSETAEAGIKQHFREVSQTNLAVLFWPAPSTGARAVEQAIGRVESALVDIRGVSLSHQAREDARFAAGLGPIVMPLLVKVNEETAQTAVDRLQAALAMVHARTHVAVHLLGESALWAALDSTSKRQLKRAELFGLPILLVVLLAVFGSIVAAVLPLILGAVSVTITGAVIYLVSQQVQLSVFTTNTASMIGIGVAVDYSLIVLARMREEIRAGRDIASARRVTLATAGQAVIFSGITVIGALCGIFLVPIEALRSMALGAIIVVTVAVVASTSLLPAVVTILGAHRITKRRWARRSKRWDIFQRWTDVIMRRPIAVLVLSASFLAMLCIPAISLRASTGALSQLGRNDPTRAAFSDAAKSAGAGSLGPVQMFASRTADVSRDKFQTWVDGVRRVVQRLPEVRTVEVAEYSSEQHYALIAIVPRTAPESPEAKHLVARLRELSRPPGVSVAIGGASAMQADEEHAVATSMWKVVAVVLGLAFVALVFLLRSLVLSLKAVLTTLLSVGAAYGVLVTIFQWGWLHKAFGYVPLGHLETFTPPLVLAVAFGLSTDYEVFLLSRIREQWLASGDAKAAVEEGLKASARTISSAALILVCVFAVFVVTGMPAIKEIGVGAAVAIGLDATVVRLMLVPALMALLGDLSWWTPRWLNRGAMRQAVPATYSPSGD